ncbi:hypothetical protein BV898_16617 [Hypsibius exemplaris]|uniref:Uncharacterized protein n=1 Tax=Hypsibius exemplaris TaxID=2072580 RepID=A0A9X6NDV0_HYPEX|nr:hypothetical protein BV898_16617 [Hypsibius exemplaris]
MSSQPNSRGNTPARTTTSKEQPPDTEMIAAIQLVLRGPLKGQGTTNNIEGEVKKIPWLASLENGVLLDRIDSTLKNNKGKLFQKVTGHPKTWEECGNPQQASNSGLPSSSTVTDDGLHVKIGQLENTIKGLHATNTQLHATIGQQKAQIDGLLSAQCGAAMNISGSGK